MGQLGRRPNRPRGRGLAAAVARARGLAAAKTGAITFVQRFGGLVGVFGPAAKARSKLRALIPATNTADAATCPTAGTSIPMRARRLP